MPNSPRARLLRPFLALVALSLFSGCSLLGDLTGRSDPSGPASSATAPSTPASGVPATPGVTETPTTPGATTSPAVAGLPTRAGAIDVSSYEEAHFASPSGRIWCALSADFALCHFPRGMDDSTVPPPIDVCPELVRDDVPVTGVIVKRDRPAEYFCSLDPAAVPWVDEGFVDWWRSTDFPSVEFDGTKAATLPYGQKLVFNQYICESARTGVTCADLNTGRGFTVALRGVTLLGG